jgi:thioredoxin 1
MQLVLGILLATMLNVGMARAATETIFDQKTFAAAQQSGEPIMVDITASWCPTCAAQRP